MEFFGKKSGTRSAEETEQMVRRQRKLMELASQDKTYGIWLGIFAEAKEEFTAYLEQQPPEVQSILCAALGTCEMLNQRLIHVACTHMEFVDPKYRK